MTSKLTREERVQALCDLKVGQVLSLADIENVKMLSRMALAAMDSEPEYLPLDYLQGHRDGLEWAAQLTEANHPETGDWLYDDPIELAKAIRKGPDMPPAQPAADSEPVAEVLSNRPGNDTSTIDRALPVGTQLYRHAQQPVVPDDVLDALQKVARIRLDMNDFDGDCRGIADCLCDAEEALIEVVNRRAAMFNHPEQHLDMVDHSGDVNEKGGDGNSPVIPDGYVMVPKEPTDEMIAAAMNCEDVLFNSDDSFCVQFGNIYEAMLAAAPQSPGSEPATVPGKWIPVSERMPEVGDIVLTAMGGVVNVGEMECSAANCRLFTSVISGRELPATHWLPLPAGPKEDINALIPLVSRNEQEGK